MARRPRSKKLKPLYRCEVCSVNVEDHPEHISRHEKGDRHQRLEELFLKNELLKTWNIEWVDKNYMCITCDEILGLSFLKIKEHFESQHMCPITTHMTSKTTVLEVFKKFKKKKYYENEYDFDGDKINFSSIEGPTELVESVNNCVGLLTLDVISKSQIQRLYEMASFLELKGKPCTRGKKKQSSRMVMFGLFENHQCGW